MKKVRIFFADDHQIVIKGLLEIFDEYNNQPKDDKLIQVIGYASTTEELLKNVSRKNIDVFMIDLGFSGTQGDISIIKMILEINPSARIVVFSMRKNINTIQGCYRAGAKAYVSKNESIQELIKAILAVAQNEDYFVPGVLDQIGLMSVRDPLAALDERDAKLFIRLSQNVDIKAVEQEFGISEKTINNIVTYKIKPVLGVSRKDFRLLALKMGLIEDID